MFLSIFFPKCRAKIAPALILVQEPCKRGDNAMNQPNDPNRTVDVPSVPADSLDVGLAAGFGRPADSPGSVLAGLRESLGALPPVLLKEAEGESAHIIQPKTDAMPPSEQTGDRYQLQGEIARGGMGAVLRGHDVDLGRDLAVKVLLEKHAHRPEVARRFIEEAQIGGQLQHPGVVPVYDIGRFGERPFFTMKLLKGQTLGAQLGERADPAADRPRFLAIALQVAQTLAYAHAKGVIHRDLKPANVMVGAFGEVQVMDWGLAKVLAEGGVADEERAASRQHQRVDETQIRTARSTGSAGGLGTETEAGSLLGTPAYMPPEQANGDVALLDRRADVFGLGAILCEVLTGKPPYVGRSAEEVRRKAANGDLADATARLDGCGADADLIALTKTCLSPEAIDRPRDAQAVADGLATYLNGAQERAQAAERERAVAVARASEERRRRRVQLALAASVLALLMLGGLGTAYYLQQRAERDRQRIEQAAAFERVVGHAVTLRDQAVAHPEDVSRWQVALVAVEQAEVGDDATARDRLVTMHSEIKAGLAAAERDRTLLDRLVEIRSAEADDPGGSATDAAYAAAFREAGIDLVRLTPAEAGAKIMARPASVVPGLTAAIDDWAAIRRGKRKNAAGAAQLTAVARIADPDPWRSELRTALDQADKEARLTALQALAKTAKFEELGPISLHLLGSALNADGDSALAESVLRKAQQRHPGDVWVNYDLGAVLGKLQRRDEAIRFYTVARALRPETAHVLAHALDSRGDTDEAIGVFCDLVARRPTEMRHLGCLSATIGGHGQSREVAAALEPAVAAIREAVRLKPDDAAAHACLGKALRIQGKLEEAIAEIRTVKRLEPNRTIANGIRATGQNWGLQRLVFAISDTPDQLITRLSFDLGNALRDQGKLDQAIAAYQEAIGVTPNYYAAYSALVPVLKAQGKLDETVAAYREAVRLKPDDAEAYFRLGGLFQAQRDFAGALAQYRKGHELGSEQPGWKYPSAQWLADLEFLRVVFEGQAPPKDNNERLRLAQMCEERKWLADAARLTAAALENDPKLVDDIQGRTRHKATGRAVLAGVGQGEDAPRPNEAARKRWRTQARDFFRADLRLYAKTLEAGNASASGAVVDHLQHWKACPDLAPVRDPEARKNLPEAESQEWQVLWGEVEALLKQAEDRHQQLTKADEMADELAVRSQLLLAQKKWAEAEPLIRQCLAIREKSPDAWSTFNAKSMLGGALLGQKQYAEAEPLLLAGYEGMKQRERSIPPEGKIHLTQAVERLVPLYEALDKKDEVARWTKEREALEALAKKVKELEQTSAAVDRAIAAGRTQDALLHLVALSGARPDDMYLFAKLAALQAWFGQDKELAETCRRGLALAKYTTVPETADRVAKACCLLPSTDKAQLEAALGLARKAVQLGKGSQNQFWFQLALGMAEYRSGHFAEAAAALIAAPKGYADNPHVAGTSAFYRAMSLFRQGKEDEARTLATAAAAKMKPLPKDEKNPLADNANSDNLILWMAYKEAKALIKFEPHPAAPAPSSGK
jgi:serine/threonine-protein kinase